MRGLPGLIPHWILVWMFLGGLVAMLFRRWRLTSALMMPPVVIWLIVPLKHTVIDGLPLWWQWPAELAFTGILLLLMVYAVVMIIFGRGVADYVVGEALNGLFKLVFRALPVLSTGGQSLMSRFASQRRASPARLGERRPVDVRVNTADAQGSRHAATPGDDLQPGDSNDGPTPVYPADEAVPDAGNAAGKPSAANDANWSKGGPTGSAE